MCNTTRTTTTILAILGAAAFAGCSAKGPAPISRCAVADFGGNDLDNQMNFWHSLSERSVTCNEDAVHGMLLYFYDEDPADSYEERVALLKQQGLLPAGWSEPADHPASRGTLAVAIANAMQLEGGVTMQLVGRNIDRYSLRELQYNGVFPTSSPNQPVTGTEFVGLMGRVEDFQRGNPSNAPAAQLPSEALGKPLTEEEIKELESMGAAPDEAPAEANEPPQPASESTAPAEAVGTPPGE